MRRIMATCQLLVASAALCAAEPLIAADPAESGWQSTSGDMAYTDYLDSVDHNRKLLHRQLRLHADRLVYHAGGYRQAIRLAGTAAAVALEDARMELGDSGNYAVVLRDSTESDRSVLFEFRKRW